MLEIFALKKITFSGSEIIEEKSVDRNFREINKPRQLTFHSFPVIMYFFPSIKPYVIILNLLRWRQTPESYSK